MRIIIKYPFQVIQTDSKTLEVVLNGPLPLPEVCLLKPDELRRIYGMTESQVDRMTAAANDAVLNAFMREAVTTRIVE